MTDRERFVNVLNYQPVDRCFYAECLWTWPETYERWEKEGYDPAQEPLFDTDRWDIQISWFFPNPPFEREIVAEDEATISYISEEGILLREMKDQPMSSMPQFLRFPVETRDDFRRFWKERMRPDLAARIGPDYAQKLSAYRSRDFPLIVYADKWAGFFGPLRSLVGVEKLCTLFYDDPAFVEEMMDADADFIIAMMDHILDYTDIDLFMFWEDMCYKTSSLISPQMACKYMLPRYRRVTEFLRSRGVNLIGLDSDGNISPLIPVWLDAGINLLFPWERQCDLDIIASRREYGRELRIWAGVDKRAIAAGPQAIDRELERVRPLIEEGGYIPALDHGLPPDVSFANYCYYMEKLREVL